MHHQTMLTEGLRTEKYTLKPGKIKVVTQNARRSAAMPEDLLHQAAQCMEAVIPAGYLHSQGGAPHHQKAETACA